MGGGGTHDPSHDGRAGPALLRCHHPRGHQVSSEPKGRSVCGIGSECSFQGHEVCHLRSNKSE